MLNQVVGIDIMVADQARSSEALDALTKRIATNITEVRNEIRSIAKTCGRKAEEIRLIAVTKSQTPAVITPLHAAGIFDFGENRLDHLERMTAATHVPTHYHYIGRVQGRQLAKLIPHCSTLHSLCEADHIERLGRACQAAARPMSVFLQVNTAQDDAKSGMLEHELASRLELAEKYPQLSVVGLMTMAPLTEAGEQADEKTVRQSFAKLRNLAEQYHLPRLSMGMSHDFALAILEGATDLRIGTRLFS